MSTITMPIPQVAPFGMPLDKPESAAQEIWDAFVKPDQERGDPQSVEMRMLMALLRAFAQATVSRLDTTQPRAPAS